MSHSEGVNSLRTSNPHFSLSPRLSQPACISGQSINPMLQVEVGSMRSFVYERTPSGSPSPTAVAGRTLRSGTPNRLACSAPQRPNLYLQLKLSTLLTKITLLYSISGGHRKCALDNHLHFKTIQVKYVLKKASVSNLTQW